MIFRRKRERLFKTPPEFREEKFEQLKLILKVFGMVLGWSIIDYFESKGILDTKTGDLLWLIILISGVISILVEASGKSFVTGLP